MTAVASKPTLLRKLIKPSAGNSYRRCPKDWTCQPKVNDHRLAILLNRNQVDHIVFANDGKEYTKATLPDEWIKMLHGFWEWLEESAMIDAKLTTDWPYLLDAGIMGPAYGDEPTALVIHDLPRLGGTYSERLTKIRGFFPRWEMYEELEPNEGVFVLPTWRTEYNPIHWKAMQEHNKDIGKHVYEGIVAKDPDSLYPYVTNKRKYPYWVKYRFDQLN